MRIEVVQCEHYHERLRQSNQNANLKPGGTPVLATNTGETRGMSLYDPQDEDQLQIHLYKILYEQHNPDLKSFQELFQQEAQQNLQSILNVININS